MLELSANRPQLDLVRESQEELKKAILASQHETFESSCRSKFFSITTPADLKVNGEDAAKSLEEEELRRSKTDDASLIIEEYKNDRGISNSSDRDFQF